MSFKKKFYGILKHIFDVLSNYLSVRSLLPKIKKYLDQKNLQRGVLFITTSLSLFVLTSHFVYAGEIADALAGAFNILLYGVLEVLSWALSAAVTLFGYAVDAGNLSGPNGMLNLQATYDMWKFVRDIINVGFIFGLLFIAFAFIFQIHGYSDKKVILKLIGAALLVNFSFPLARVLIDFANVPMYFFLQMILGDNGSGAISSALSSSQLSSILVPESAAKAFSKDTSLLILNIIFMFIFTITLAVLAIQFLIRMIALVILVILSPIGFAASGIPGLKSYGGKWWDSFLKYSLFGPAAAFMLVLATNFLAAVNGGGQYEGFRQIASENTQDTSLVASMGLFAIPIVMLWFTVGIAGKFSVAGASISKDYGQKFIKSTGKKFTGYAKNTGKYAASPITNRAKGLSTGLKQRAYDGRLFGDGKLSKYTGAKYFSGKASKERAELAEAKYRGYGNKGKSGVTSELEKLHIKKVAEEEKSLEEGRTSETALRATMNDANANKAKREAAVRVLSKKDALRTGADMDAARDAIRASNINPDAAREKERELVKKAGGEIYQSGAELASAIELLGDDVKGISSLVDKASGKALSLTPDQYNDTINKIPAVARDAIKGKVDSKLKKEGKIKVLIDAEIDANAKAGLAVPHREVYGKYLKDMTASDIGKMKDLHGDATTPIDQKLVDYIKARKSSGDWTDQEIQDAYSKLGRDQKKNWRGAGLV